MSVEDVIEILAIDLIGNVPDDENIVVSTNNGDPIVNNQSCPSGKAYMNICRRITGEEVPFLEFSSDKGFLGKLKSIMGFNN